MHVMDNQKFKQRVFIFPPTNCRQCREQDWGAVKYIYTYIGIEGNRIPIVYILVYERCIQIFLEIEIVSTYIT